MCYSIASAQNDLYEETPIEVNLPQNLGVYRAIEYRHKTTRLTFKTEIYMFLKLTMGLLGFDCLCDNPRRAYHILIESKDHFDHFHRGEHPILIQTNSNNSASPTIKISKEPLYQE